MKVENLHLHGQSILLGLLTFKVKAIWVCSKNEELADVAKTRSKERKRITFDCETVVTIQRNV